jgi:hypothetical protein
LVRREKEPHLRRPRRLADACRDRMNDAYAYNLTAWVQLHCLLSGWRVSLLNNCSRLGHSMAKAGRNRAAFVPQRTAF